jgi:hypothetical protein
MKPEGPSREVQQDLEVGSFEVGEQTVHDFVRYLRVVRAGKALSAAIRLGRNRRVFRQEAASGAAPRAALPSIFQEQGGISRNANLCQICARPLLIWHNWAIWEHGRTVTYEESTGGQIPIPSLATT